MYNVSSPPTSKSNTAGKTTKDNKIGKSIQRKKSTPGGLSHVVQNGTNSGSSSNLSPLLQKNGLQPKMKIGNPNDKFEQEADQMAEKVTRSMQHGKPHSVQRKSEAKPMLQAQEEEQAKPMLQAQEEEQAKPMLQAQEEEQAKPMLQAQEEEQAKPMLQAQEEEQAKPMLQAQEEEQAKPMLQAQEEEQTKPKLQAQEEEQAKPLLQAQEEEQAKPIMAKGSPGGTASVGLTARVKNAKGGGQPLPHNLRGGMESHFGHDFSRVRIHTGPEAAQMNKELHAQAFARGSDIFFNEGKYEPGTTTGQKLLAHELTHTAQQGASPSIQKKSEQTTAPTQKQLSDEEKAALKAELAASETKAVKAINPKPAEMAKKKAEKTEAKKDKKEKVKPEKKGKKHKKAIKSAKAKVEKGKPAPPAKKEKELGDVAKDLEQASASVCGEASAKAGELATNEQRHDDAGEKLKQTNEAVKPPDLEGQSKSNSEQVAHLEAREAPEPTEEGPKAHLDADIEQAVPTKIEDLNEFKSKGKAKVVGAKVLGNVKKETDAVNKTYKEIENAPVAKPPEHTPTELPPREAAPVTPELNLGKEAVPPLKDSHTDFSKFEKDSDDLLQKEGITQEQMDMVDEGELAEANKERKGIKKNVAEEPAKIKEFAQQETQKVETDLKHEEKKDRAEMVQKRKKALSGTEGKQRKAKTAMELKREQVTQKINAIYEAAQRSVKAKLEKLEKDSLAAFDRGQELASIEFENEVNRDINAWKSRRYSGWTGGLKWAKDKLFGIEDFPEVKQAFSSGKANYISKIDKLILKITADSKKVIADCKKEIADARKAIQKYVSTLGPDLRKTGQAAMKSMKAKLADMDKFIDKKKEELAQKLCDKKTEAIEKIDKKIEKMKESMSGALAKLGNLILQAMVKFFKWALKKAGYDSKQLMGILNKGKAVIKKIVTDPIGFIGNIIDAVKLGINNFQKNIKKHLIAGMMSWLTGQMGDAGLQLPEKFDLKGILSIVLQVLGLTWTNIRTKLVKRLGEKVVRGVETTVTIVKRVINEGPMALWEMLKEKAAEIKQQVMEGIRNWVITQLVKAAIIKLISFFNPAGAIVQAILAIYNTIMFFVENWDRIVQFVKTVFGSIADMAMGKISAAAAAVERSLAMAIPIILNFLARLIGISGIGKAVRGIIMKIRKPIDKVLNKVIDFIAKKAKKLLGKGKAGVTKGAEKIKAFFYPKHRFKGGGESHTLSINVKNKKPNVIIASTPQPIDHFLNKYLSGKNPDQKKKNKINDAKAYISTQIIPLTAKAEKEKNKTKPNEAVLKELNRQLLEKEVALSGMIKSILGTGDLDIDQLEYNLEGLTGTYSSMPKPRRDDMTADHQPQAAVLKWSASLPYFRNVAAIQHRVTGRHADNAYAINLQDIRHKAGRTYGGKSSSTLGSFKERVIKETKSVPKQQDKRNIVVELMKTELRDDVNAIRIVNSDVKNFEDIKKLNLPEEDEKNLIKKVQNQIDRGESKIASQDMESLKG